MAVFYGLKRVYCTAKNIETLVTFASEAQTARVKLAKDLLQHIEDEDKLNRARDLRIEGLASDVAEIVRETRTNGGSSMKDVINNIHARVHALEVGKS